MAPSVKVDRKYISGLASILVKLQDRLNRVGLQSSQTTAAVEVLQDQTRLSVGKLNAVVDAVKIHGERQETLNHSRALSQTDSLVKLRDSAKTAFEQVKQDVAELLKFNQRLNERVGQLESRTDSAAVVGSNLANLVHRITQLESRDGFDLNEELESRLQRVEAEVKLIEAVRTAQINFMAGPDRTVVKVLPWNATELKQ